MMNADKGMKHSNKWRTFLFPHGLFSFATSVDGIFEGREIKCIMKTTIHMTSRRGALQVYLVLCDLQFFMCTTLTEHVDRESLEKTLLLTRDLSTLILTRLELKIFFLALTLFSQISLKKSGYVDNSSLEVQLIF